MRLGSVPTKVLHAAGGAADFLLVEVFRPLLPYGLGFAAGAMAWMVFAELLPDARKEAPARLVVAVVSCSPSSPCWRSRSS